MSSPPQHCVPEELLVELVGRIPGAVGAGVVDREGFVLAAVGMAGRSHRLGTGAAGLINVGESTVHELQLGSFEDMQIRGETGSVVLVKVGREAALAIVTSREAKIGVTLAFAREFAKTIEGLL